MRVGIHIVSIHIVRGYPSTSLQGCGSICAFSPKFHGLLLRLRTRYREASHPFIARVRCRTQFILKVCTRGFIFQYSVVCVWVSIHENRYIHLYAYSYVFWYLSIVGLEYIFALTYISFLLHTSRLVSWKYATKDAPRVCGRSLPVCVAPTTSCLAGSWRSFWCVSNCVCRGSV